MQRRAGRAPPGHLSRLKPVELDPLDEYGLPSKGEKRLLSPKVQEAYFTRIAERYLAFCTDAGDRDGLEKQFARLAITTSSSPQPAPSPNQTPTNLPQILSALRKLREALVATSRQDAFASQVYLFAIRLGILASHPETYHPALLHLLRTIHRPSQPITSTPTNEPPNNTPTTTTTTITTITTTTSPTTAAPLTRTELHEAASYLILDAACRRHNLSEAYALRHQYRSLLSSPSSTTNAGDPKLNAILHALVTDNWVAWRRLKAKMDGPRARLMDFAEGEVRGHTLKAFGRAYLSVPVGMLEAQTGKGWEELREGDGVGWELEEEGRVVIRRMKGR